jgi:hypothetical protein
METRMRNPSTATLLTILAVVAVCFAAAAPAAAQATTPWGWAAVNTTPGQGSWDPHLFADYLLTGQTPHPSVARIIAPDQGGVSLGSGVLVDVNRTQGLILTNWHVIRDSRSAVLVQFPDGFQSAGTVIRYDEAWDLAALVVWKPRAAPIALADRPPAIGEALTIAGFGRGAYRAETGPCTEYLSPGTGYGKEFVELAATARQGDSGGPILDADGKLAGVLFGQNGGRTIGSCSTRLRTFLASVGSQGFTATPIAEFSDTPAIARGIGAVPAQLHDGHAPATRLASMPVDDTLQRSMHLPTPAVPGLPGPFASPTRDAPVLDAPMLASLANVFDVRQNGQALLAAAGGLALALLGLRTIIASRS